MGLRLLPECGEVVEIGLIGTAATLGQGAQARRIGGGIDRFDQPVQPGRARLKAGTLQLGDRRLEHIKPEFAALQLTRSSSASWKTGLNRGVRRPLVEIGEASFEFRNQSYCSLLRASTDARRVSRLAADRGANAWVSSRQPPGRRRLGATRQHGAPPGPMPGSAVETVLDRLGSREAELLARRDRDGCAGRGIAAFAGGAFLDLELAKAVDETSSPLAAAPAITSKTVSTAFLASALVMLFAAATASMSSLVFIGGLASSGVKEVRGLARRMGRRILPRMVIHHCDTAGSAEFRGDPGAGRRRASQNFIGHPFIR